MFDLDHFDVVGLNLVDPVFWGEHCSSTVEICGKLTKIVENN